MRREFHVRFCEGVGVRFPRATRLLNGRELDDEMLEKLTAQMLTALFNEKPVLKSFLGFDDEDDKPRGSDTADGKPSGAIREKNKAKPIETPEEMRIATETLREGLRLLVEEQGHHSPRLTESAKKALYVVRQKQGELIEPVMRFRTRSF